MSRCAVVDRRGLLEVYWPSGKAWIRARGSTFDWCAVERVVGTLRGVATVAVIVVCDAARLDRRIFGCISLVIKRPASFFGDGVLGGLVIDQPICRLTAAIPAAGSVNGRHALVVLAPESIHPRDVNWRFFISACRYNPSVVSVSCVGIQSIHHPFRIVQNFRLVIPT